MTTAHLPSLGPLAPPNEEGEIEAPPFPHPAPNSVWSQTVFDCTYDPVEFVKSAFMVKTKAAKVVPFNLFKTQDLYSKEITLKNIVVKPRQVGMSTFHLGIMTAVSATTPNMNSLIITHRDDSTESMHETLKKNIEWLNDFHDMDIRLGRNNEDMMQLLPMDSWFFFGSGTAPGVGRSRTIQMMLASELAHWPGENPGKEFSAMTESIPDGGLIFAESTPNGAAGPFYEIYNEPGNGYSKHFFPWFIEPSRRIRFKDPNYQLELTSEEQLLVSLHNLDHEQIAWRRRKWKQMKSQGLYFPQEYPEDDVTCFIAGLKSAFPAEKLAGYLNIARVILPSEVNIPGQPSDPGGTLKVWEPPQTGVPYVIAGDVGGGHQDGDYSVAIVRKATTGEHVATLEGHWTPVSFAAESVRLALYYNTALLSHESNGLGLSCVDHCVNVLRYPNYYYEQRGTSANQETFNPNAEWFPGFNVSATSKNWMMNTLVQEVGDGRFRSKDQNLIRQMSAARMERKKQYGRWLDVIEIPQNIHDDHLMCYAQSCMLMQQPVNSNSRPGPQPGM